MNTRRKGDGSRLAATKLVAVAHRATQLARTWSRERPPGGVWEHWVETLEARIAHLETALEGLQDAVYRQAVLEDENIADLRRRIEPDRMARDLSQDARRRGL